MSLKAGIVGLPNVGKSTLFSALTSIEVESANYAFTTIEPNISVVSLKDKRLSKINEFVKAEKIIPTTFTFVDIAGLVKGASKGEGLGNKFLSNIREVDAIIHVVRCFENDDIVHVENKINPVEDARLINLELLFADLQVIENVIKRVEKKALNTNDKVVKQEYEVAKKLQNAFNNNIFARNIELSEDELKIIKGYQLLTLKPMIYVANISQKDLENIEKSHYFTQMKEFAKKENAFLLPISVVLEYEISKLDDEEKDIFLQEYNLEYSGLELLTREAFKILNLKTFFTAGVKEVRAWTFTKNMNASECASVIHSDFEKKFIKAEVISYNDYIENQGEKKSKENGKMRLEGKNYLMEDGDICYFRVGK
ncbi:redox-regulated ATPase YchF [Mesomycoplasma neurolyticum]|uniref:Ribosome-binding ATPase YchF n=1 Tax=Mesomycoplasma neurolyticum TaxID=2120 RepID=A0A449A5T7_9BACT|nr:redox-regulated ATPase YchF [Mesomycoplasma neurolyticum]VEU59650.1 GTP-binding and nucleic acid-binding protein YchF [Mesomycoplasma neurolyticum]